MESLFNYFPGNIEVLSATVEKIELPPKGLDASITRVIKNIAFKKGTFVKLSKTRLSDFNESYMVPIYSIEKIERYKDTNKLRVNLRLILKEDYFSPTKTVSKRGQTPMTANRERQQPPQRRPLVMYITLENIKLNQTYNALKTIDKTLLEYAEEQKNIQNQELLNMAGITEGEPMQRASSSPDPWADSTPSSSSASPWTSADRAKYKEEQNQVPFNFNSLQPQHWSNQAASTSKGGAKKYARLDTLTKQELIDRCRAKKIPYSGRNKAELVALLRK
jgi:hypothetical protein